MSTLTLSHTEILTADDLLDGAARITLDQEFFGTAFTIASSKSYGFEDGNAGHVIAFPDGAAALDDVIVLFASSDTFIATPAGYTQAAVDIGNMGAYVFTLHCAGGETGTTITTSGNFPTIITYVRVTGADPTTPFDVVAHAASTSSASNTPPYSPTALTNPGECVLVAACLSGAQGAVQKYPTWSLGFGNVIDQEFVSATLSTAHTQHQFVGINLNASGTPAPACTWTNPTDNQTLLYITINPAPAVTGTIKFLTPDPLTATATLAVAVRSARPVAATLAASAAMAFTPRAARPAATTLTASATLAGTLTRVRPAPVSLSAAAMMTVQPRSVRRIAASLAAAASLTAAVRAVRQAGTSLTGTAALAFTPRAARAAAASLTATAGLTVANSRARPVATTLTATSTLATSVRAARPVAVVLVSSSSLIAQPRRVRPISVNLAAGATLSVTANRAASLKLVLAAAADLRATTIAVRTLAADLEAEALLTVAFQVAGTSAVRTSRLSVGTTGSRLGVGSTGLKTTASSSGARLHVGT